MANGGEPGVHKANVVPRWLKTLWDAHPLIVVSGVVVVALAVALGLLWPLTDVIAAHDVGLTTGSTRPARLQAAREAVRTQLLTLGAGVFAVGALIFTARNFALSRGALDETRRTVELTRHTVELTEQGQVTDRYTKAIEQLGSDRLDVRIGGIYAMERIARDSARDHPTVMEVLVAFIREHSREQWPLPEPGAEIPKRSTRPDVQAAITVIGRRDIGHDRQPINLTGANLTGANLTGANLTGADLTGADLTGADLTGAYLTGADLTDADLTRADLTYSNLTDAYLTRADLTDADLTRANLTYAYLTRANLTRANLTLAYLTRANLTGAFLVGADLTGANLSSAEFSEGAQVPEGWLRDPGSGRLELASAEPGEAPTLED